MLLTNPNTVLKDREDDEACEIDSDYSDNPEDDEDDDNDHSGDKEESKNIQKKNKRKLEESIRSSRTATFKSIRRTSTHNTAYMS